MPKINRNQPTNEENRRKLRVLLAPLDWGLGHATRCIPIIYELMDQGAEVWLAGEGHQETLLRTEFPNLEFLPLPGYRVKFSRSRSSMLRGFLFQVPKMLRAIKNENKWLQQAIAEYEFDAVISDNRYGLHHAGIPSIFITHQLLIKNPLGATAERLLDKRNYAYINNFTECWIPDESGNNNAGGDLSHPSRLPKTKLKYIGLLSRLTNRSIEINPGHLFVSLSGPEPQRTILENKIINQISHYNGTATIVRGLPSNNTLIPSTNDIRFYNHLSTDDYSNEIAKADFVISRSGYSTLMDIIKLNKKSILIPTPGQSEQEYLATHLQKKKWAITINQNDFLLTEALSKAQNFQYQLPSFSETNTLANAIRDLLVSCR